jgi:hypothetical protein
LVVDDEPDITLTLKAGLEIVGLFDVDAYSDPESALKSFKPNYQFDSSITNQVLGRKEVRFPNGP